MFVCTSIYAPIITLGVAFIWWTMISFDGFVWILSIFFRFSMLYHLIYVPMSMSFQINLFVKSFLFLPLIFFILMILSSFFEILWFFFLFFLCLSNALKFPCFLCWTKRLWTIWTFINEIWKYFLESWHVPFISFFISLVCSQMFLHFWVQKKYNEPTWLL